MMKEPIVIHQEQWYELGREGERIPIICCACGLTHEWQFEIQEDGVILGRCRVDKRTTNRIRRRGDAELFGKSTEYEIVKRRAK